MAAALLARYLVCPVCSKSSTLTELDTAVVCSNCKASFDEHDAIVDLVQGSFATALDAETYDDFYADADADRFGHLEQLLELVPELRARKWGSVLEVGAGTGQFTSTLFNAIEVVDAVITDVSEKMLAQCSRRLDETGHRISHVQFATNSGEDLFVHPGTFDLVIGNGVVHHVPNYLKMLASTAQALVPGGLAVFVEPCLDFHRALATTLTPVVIRLLSEPDVWAAETDAAAVVDFLMYLRFRDRFGADFEVLEWLEDKHMFDRSEVSRAAFNAGFSEAEILPYGFDPDPCAVLSGYLSQVGVHAATVARVSKEASLETPGPFVHLDPRDSASSYVFVLHRGYDTSQPTPLETTEVELAMVDSVPGLKYHLSISRDAAEPAVEGWAIAGQPVRYVLFDRGRDRFRFPVGGSRIDVLESFRDPRHYRPEELLYSGVLPEARAVSQRPFSRDDASAVSIEFDGGVAVQLAGDAGSHDEPVVFAS